MNAMIDKLWCRYYFINTIVNMMMLMTMTITKYYYHDYNDDEYSV